MMQAICRRLRHHYIKQSHNQIASFRLVTPLSDHLNGAENQRMVASRYGGGGSGTITARNYSLHTMKHLMAEELAALHRRSNVRSSTTNTSEPEVDNFFGKFDQPLNVKMLEGKGIPSKQAEAIISAITSLSHQRVKYISLVLHDDETKNDFIAREKEWSKSNAKEEDSQEHDCMLYLCEFAQVPDHVKIGIELRSELDHIKCEECIKLMQARGDDKFPEERDMDMVMRQRIEDSYAELNRFLRHAHIFFHCSLGTALAAASFLCYKLSF